MRKSKKRNVAYILDKVPAARHNKKLLLVLYWNLFDDAGIPSECVERIIMQGAEPEAVFRDVRRIKENIRKTPAN